jgi:hypothetical protein
MCNGFEANYEGLKLTTHSAPPPPGEFNDSQSQTVPTPVITVSVPEKRLEYSA